MTLYSSRADLFIVSERTVLSGRLVLFLSECIPLTLGSRGANGFFFIEMDALVVFFRAVFLLTSEGSSVTQDFRN